MRFTHDGIEVKSMLVPDVLATAVPEVIPSTAPELIVTLAEPSITVAHDLTLVQNVDSASIKGVSAVDCCCYAYSVKCARKRYRTTCISSIVLAFQKTEPLPKLVSKSSTQCIPAMKLCRYLLVCKLNPVEIKIHANTV
jgi:hypothetical protein